jgi:hypothetical protein
MGKRSDRRATTGEGSMMESGKVSYGYFPDHKGNAVILFSGEEVALRRLADFFDSLRKQLPSVSIIVDRQPFLSPKRGTRLTITLTDKPFGIRRVNRSSSDPNFVWGVSKELAGQFAQLTRAVATSGKPSHHYLDSGMDEVSAVVSKGEYDEASFDT